MRGAAVGQRPAGRSWFAIFGRRNQADGGQPAEERGDRIGRYRRAVNNCTGQEGPRVAVVRGRFSQNGRVVHQPRPAGDERQQGQNRVRRVARRRFLHSSQPFGRRQRPHRIAGRTNQVEQMRQSDRPAIAEVIPAPKAAGRQTIATTARLT